MSVDGKRYFYRGYIGVGIMTAPQVYLFGTRRCRFIFFFFIRWNMRVFKNINHLNIELCVGVGYREDATVVRGGGSAASSGSPPPCHTVQMIFFFLSKMVFNHYNETENKPQITASRTEFKRISGGFYTAI